MQNLNCLYRKRALHDSAGEKVEEQHDDGGYRAVQERLC